MARGDKKPESPKNEITVRIMTYSSLEVVDITTELVVKSYLPEKKEVQKNRFNKLNG